MTFVSLERASPPNRDASIVAMPSNPSAFGTAQDTVRYEAESLTGLHLGWEVWLFQMGTCSAEG